MPISTFNGFSTTASSNVDVNGISIQGTAAVQNFDNAFRELMAILRRDVPGLSLANTFTNTMTFNKTLSSGNKLVDLQQGYGLYSDNTASVGSTRLWIDAPDNGEIQLGPRAGADKLANVRVLTNSFVVQSDEGATFTADTSGVSCLENFTAGNTVTGTLNVIAGEIESSTGANSGIRMLRSGAAASIRSSTSSTGTNAHAIYYNPNGQAGSISTSGTATSFNTSSDERLKENFRAFDPGAIIDATNTYLYDWKSGGTGYGVKAQEAHGVFQDAITPGSGEPGDDDFVPWSVDYSKYVPILLAEVKALRSRVSELEAVGRD
jgi:hypothetical protein